MRFLRSAILLALALLATTATASSAGVAAPTGLHGFLLRADEPPTASFHRTPSFAWNPVAGARTYQFQLSTSSTFRDNGIVYSNSSLTTPVAAPTLTLPWITGSPARALRARARDLDSTTSAVERAVRLRRDAARRAVAAAGLSRAAPLDADRRRRRLPGLARRRGQDRESSARTSSTSASSTRSISRSAWIGTVRWRIRALRGDVSSKPAHQRAPGLAATARGARCTARRTRGHRTGPIKLIGTVSDVFSNGSTRSPAHEMMPAFLWSGNQTLDGTCDRAVPRRDLHGQAVPEPRLHRRSRRLRPRGRRG